MERPTKECTNRYHAPWGTLKSRARALKLYDPHMPGFAIPCRTPYVEIKQQEKLSSFSMISLSQVVWRDFLGLLFQRPLRQQVAALCYRMAGDEKEVLLITSRDSGRWIIPKGWPMRGKNAVESAMQEAWEEAGVVKGDPTDESIGSYTYDKKQDSGWSYPVETMVYSVEVEKLAEKFPEAHERKRKWVKLTDAEHLLQEHELQAIVRQF